MGILITKASIGSNNVPVAYCFLEDKARPSYNLVFDEQQAAAPLWNPKGIVLDFELAESWTLSTEHFLILRNGNSAVISISASAT